MQFADERSIHSDPKKLVMQLFELQRRALSECSEVFLCCSGTSAKVDSGGALISDDQPFECLQVEQMVAMIQL